MSTSTPHRPDPNQIINCRTEFFGKESETIAFNVGRKYELQYTDCWNLHQKACEKTLKSLGLALNPWCERKAVAGTFRKALLHVLIDDSKHRHTKKGHLLSAMLRGFEDDLSLSGSDYSIPKNLTEKDSVQILKDMRIAVEKSVSRSKTKVQYLKIYDFMTDYGIYSPQAIVDYFEDSEGWKPTTTRRSFDRLRSKYLRPALRRFRAKILLCLPDTETLSELLCTIL
jgi:hypothetical protein